MIFQRKPHDFFILFTKTLYSRTCFMIKLTLKKVLILSITQNVLQKVRITKNIIKDMALLHYIKKSLP